LIIYDLQTFLFKKDKTYKKHVLITMSAINYAGCSKKELLEKCICWKITCDQVSFEKGRNLFPPSLTSCVTTWDTSNTGILLKPSVSELFSVTIPASPRNSFLSRYDYDCRANIRLNSRLHYSHDPWQNA